MSGIIHLYSALGAINIGLKSRSLCTAISYTQTNLKLAEVLYKHGLLSHFYVPTDRFLKKHSIKQFCSITNKYIIPTRMERRIIVFFRWSLFDERKTLKVRSTPGHRRYVSYERLGTLLDRGSETFFISTSTGIYSAQEAYNLRIGGELLFSICY